MGRRQKKSTAADANQGTGLGGQSGSEASSGSPRGSRNPSRQGSKSSVKGGKARRSEGSASRKSQKKKKKKRGTSSAEEDADTGEESNAAETPRTPKKMASIGAFFQRASTTNLAMFGHDRSKQPATSLSWRNESLTQRWKVAKESQAFKLAEQLREARRQRTRHLHYLEKNEVGGADVPGVAYGALLCPVQQTCGVDWDAMPCQDSVVVQTMFGNQADFATRKSAGKEEEDGRNNDEGLNIGLPTLEQGGWNILEESRVLRSLSDPLHKKFYAQTVEAFGIKPVLSLTGHGDDEFHMVSFRKVEVPGTTKDVETLIRKLKGLDHANIVRLRDACESNEEIHLIYEACQGAGFAPMIIFGMQEHLSATEGARFMQQLAAGLTFAARQGFHHLDISLSNAMSISFEALFPVKLFGVGLAGVLYTGKSGLPGQRANYREAYYYRSPELARIWLDSEVHEPYKRLEASARMPTDVFAVGAVMYTALCGHPPCGGVNEVSVLQGLIEARAVFDTGFAHVDRGGIELVEHCLQRNPSKRPKMEALIGNAWVSMHVRSSEDPKRVQQCIERLRAFSATPVVKRTIARLLAEHMRPEKLRGIEDMFHSFDLKGDGELDASELGSFKADGREEVAHIFKVLDINGNARLSLDEFVVANVFAEEVLTERMLVRAFAAMDQDGTGEVTAIELYSSLRTYHNELTPDAVAEFLGDVDRDWDADIDFDEFRGFFPNVRHRDKELDRRRDESDVVLDVLEGTFKRYREASKHWRHTVKEELHRCAEQRTIAFAGDDEKATSCNKEWLTNCVGSLKKLQIFYRTPPELKISDHDLERYRKNSHFQDYLAEIKKKEKEERVNINLQDAKEREQRPKEPQVSGPLALGLYFKMHKAHWAKVFNEVVKSARDMEYQSKHRRREAFVVLLGKVEELTAHVTGKAMDYLEEQMSMLEAASIEEKFPKVPSSKARVPKLLAGDEDAAAAVNAYIDKRRAFAERTRKNKEEEQVDKEKQSRFTTEGERRYAAWAARREKQAAAVG